MTTKARIMGILNVTPDSFSDGGKFLDPQVSVERALEMAAQGADIIDMGAESTRPGSSGVPAPEQLRRLLPVLRGFRSRSKLPVSIDTQSASVAEACLDHGANMVNDVSALRRDRRMARIVAHHRCDVMLMHMRGTPKTMQRKPVYRDVIASISFFFEQRLKVCADAGITRERIWLDPGIGFGKTQAHNLTILRRLSELREFGPLAVGVSRKGFLGKLTNEPVPENRITASVAAGIWAVLQGAGILRVHDVKEHKAALHIIDAIKSGRC